MTRFSAGPGLAALGSESIMHPPRPTRRWRSRLVSRTWGRGLHICPLGRQWLSPGQEAGVGRGGRGEVEAPAPSLPEGPVLSDTELSGLLPASELGGSGITFRVVPAQPPRLLAQPFLVVGHLPRPWGRPVQGLVHAGWLCASPGAAWSSGLHGLRVDRGRVVPPQVRGRPWCNGALPWSR